MIALPMTVLPVLSALCFTRGGTTRRWPATLGALALAATLAACSKPELVAAPAVPTVAGAVVSFPGNQDPAGLRVVAVSIATDHQVLLTGRLGWDEDRTSRVFAPYAGRIDKLLASVGQPVKRGAALAQLSSADVGQAQADLHKAEADQALGRSSVPVPVIWSKAGSSPAKTWSRPRPTWLAPPPRPAGRGPDWRNTVSPGRPRAPSTSPSPWPRR